MAKITQRSLESIGPHQDGGTIRDEGNLLGRIRAKADGTITVSFYYRFRFQDRSKDFSCGTWPTDSLSLIRARRDAAKIKVGQGIDPGADKKVAKQIAQDAITSKLAEIALQRTENLTVQDLFDVWLIDGVRRKNDNAELRRAFNADVLPKIGKMCVKEVTEHDLRSVLRAQVGRGVNRAAIVTRNDLAQMFAWAEKRQPWRKLLADGNPMDLIEIEKIVSPGYDMHVQRDRVLSADEICELRDIFRKMQAGYDAAPDKRLAAHPIEKTVQCGVWIMLSTMCRVGEMLMARWDDVNLDTCEWFIPKSNVKGNVAALTVFLSPFALAQFRQLKTLTGESSWCFPAKNKDGHVCVKSISKQVGDRQARFKKGRDGAPRKPMQNRRHDNSLVLGNGKSGAWTPHDLRRTGATLMQGLGVSLDIVDRCQNHVLPGSKVRRHYLHHNYAAEKRAAWTQIGDHLEKLLRTPPNVVELGFHILGRVTQGQARIGKNVKG